MSTSKLLYDSTRRCFVIGSAVSRSFSPNRLGPATQPFPPAPLRRSPPIPEPQSLIKQQSSIDRSQIPWENGETDERDETQSDPPATMVCNM